MNTGLGKGAGFSALVNLSYWFKEKVVKKDREAAFKHS
jgi:hypothetical protein